MPRRKAAELPETPKSLPPALTLAGRENQLIATAYDIAEQQMLDGTASAQVLTHFLKAGSREMQAKIAKLEEENELLRAKTKSLEAQVNNEALLEKALKAFRSYRGEEVDEGEDDEYPDVY